MFIRPANRWQAFGIHILISLCIFLVLASVIYFWWYPGFLFLHDGGIDGMKLIAGVDFFIGPILTLCVYKLGKKSLPFDLACIAVFQLACLVGGMWTVWSTRTIAVVYAAGSFATTNAYGYTSQKIDIKKVPQLQTRWPVWLSVNLPKGQENQLKAVWAVMGSGLEYSTENYAPYAKNLPELTEKGLHAADTKRKNIKELQTLENANPAVRFFPVTTSTVSDAWLAVDIKTGKEVAFFK
jgi:hypothetical protein